MTVDSMIPCSSLGRMAHEYFHAPNVRTTHLGMWSYAVLLSCFLLLLGILSPRRRYSINRSVGLPPTARSNIPLWDHTIAMAYGGKRLFALFKSYCGAQSPVRFRLLGQDLILLSAADMRKTVHNPHIFTDRNLRARFIANVFGIPQLAADVVGDDNSGSGQRPIPGSNVPSERRIVRMQQETAFDFLQSKEGIGTFLEQFSRYLEEGISPQGFSKSWQELPDFYDFVRTTSSTAVINAVCGPKLLKSRPDFVKSFWIFDENIHHLHIRLPRFLIPKAYEARQNCLDALTEWKNHARKTTKHRAYDANDRWDEDWGLQIMRTRDGLYDRFVEYRSEAARAGSDLGIIWASNDNLIPIAFWFVYNLVRSPTLRERCVVEMNKARLPILHRDDLPRFDSEILVQQPLLQSVYHEVLRTQVTSFIARDVEQDYILRDYLIPQGSYALTVPWIENHNETRWSEARNTNGHPVDEFWPERFLTCLSAGEETRFSLKGLEGSFLPFGTGHHICPGRHFATRAILNLAATLIIAFDFEPLNPAAWTDPGMDPRSFGYTPFRTLKKLPFRVRKV